MEEGLDDQSPSMKPYILVILAAVLFLALFIGLEPLLTFPIWGSDTGEYYYLTQYLVSHSSLLHSSSYTGWGTAYPDFPGVFILSGAVAESTGLSSLVSLEYMVPVVGAMATVPLFLLFRRLFHSDGVALLGAAVAAVVFPRVFIISHPTPDTLGDFLAISALWMFVEMRRDVRWVIPLSIVSPALIVSHHLSSYFFLLSAVGILVGLELVAPRRWSVRFPVREFVFLGGFVAALFAYWALYATTFSQDILTQGIPSLHVSSSLLLILLGVLTIIGLVILSALVQLRRTRLGVGRSLFHLRWPTSRKLYRDASILAILVFGCTCVLIFVPIPGTGQTILPLDLIWFSPFLLLVPLSAGGIPTSSVSRIGPVPYLWLIAILISAAFATATNSQALPVGRHVEYMAIALALVTAIAIGGLVGRLDTPMRRRAAVVGAVVLVVGLNAALAYPPPQLTLGFQEGFTSQDIAVATWASSSLPSGSVLASDHRLSDLYFGFSGNPATWSTTCHLFLGNTSACDHYDGNTTAQAELASSWAPHGTKKPVDAVAVDQTMVSSGVALDPSQPALPMNSSALAFLQGPQFTLLYENGAQDLWWYTP
jgi:hypothetical protein